MPFAPYAKARKALGFSSSPAARKTKSSPTKTKSNLKTVVDSSSIGGHTSTRSVDVPPRTAASTSSGATNSVKLVSSVDETAESERQLPMPHAVSIMTLSNFLPKDNNQSAQPNGHLNSNSSTTDAAMQQSDHTDLPLRSAPNGTQKTYNMAPATMTSPAVNGSTPVTNGAFSSSDRLTLPNNRGTPTPISTVRALSGQFGGARSHSNLRDANTASDGAAAPEWSSAVGGATMSGKSGRMIEKLMTERDAMKRQNAALEAEKMEWLRERAMTNEKVERAQDEFANDLHEANTNKLLLKKRDRQVQELREKIEIERSKAVKAEENAAIWKSQLQKVQQECNLKVARAEEGLLQSRAENAVMASHWKHKIDEFEKARKRLDADKKEFLADKVAHADILAQRDQIFLESNKRMDDIAAAQRLGNERFENHTKEVEEDLSGIKGAAAGCAQRAEDLQKELKETLDKMKWVMNVKKNVKGAE